MCCTIQVDEISISELYGKLIRVVIQCSVAGDDIQSMCLAFKLQGLQEGEVTLISKSNHKYSCYVQRC